SAAPTCLPRTRSTTNRAFCGETRIYLASALAVMLFLLCRLGRLLRRGLHRVAFEGARGRKLAELVSHHLLRDVARDKFLAVVDRDRLSHKLGKDRRSPRPRAYDLLLVGSTEDSDLRLEMGVGERSLLYRSAHSYLFLLLRLTIHLSVRLLLRVL